MFLLFCDFLVQAKKMSESSHSRWAEIRWGDDCLVYEPRSSSPDTIPEVPVLRRRTVTEVRMSRAPQSSVSSVRGRNYLAGVERVVKRTTTQSTQTPPLCQLRANQTTPAPKSVRTVGTMGSKVYLEVRPNTC
ncbi:uncharacterized protein LOC123686326 [Harmonia axyridis]|uniref:uncharacterized protein LOC123686318 n=1 Tax=Harmonia axyridis TaxID=115357 RepID=UPI001E279A0D|nr:uncharacterized protein LOC123686318 [Harmonia axyridis]XP_045482341.1 uncharacterized protein LOC123686326 [Harmonia axyridis]